MGLTIVHKSDLSAQKKNPRIALVLAGGAVTGGAYKLGGLKALDDFLVNRKTTDFDIYVGLSAGAFLAAPLAGGVTPPEMLRSLDGTSADFTYFSPLDFYQFNAREFASKPIEFLVDLLTYFPNAAYEFLIQTPNLVRQLQEPLARARRKPSELGQRRSEIRVCSGVTGIDRKGLAMARERLGVSPQSRQRQTEIVVGDGEAMLDLDRFPETTGRLLEPVQHE